MDRILEKQEAVQSAVSYGSGGGLIGLASLPDLAHFAQDWAIILGCLVVAVRLIHDAIALVRFIKKKPKE